MKTLNNRHTVIKVLICMLRKMQPALSLLHFYSHELNTLYIVRPYKQSQSTQILYFDEGFCVLSQKSQTPIYWITETLPCKSYTGSKMTYWAWSKVFLRVVSHTMSSSRNLTGYVQSTHNCIYTWSLPVLLLLHPSVLLLFVYELFKTSFLCQTVSS